MKRFAFVLGIICAFPCLAVAKSSMGNVEDKLYLGADLTHRWGKFEQDRGNNVLKKDNPNVNFFVGYDICERLGLELGYETTFKRGKTSRIPSF